MATSITTQIADQIATDLAAAVTAVQLAPAFVPVRKFLPREDFELLAAAGNKLFITPTDRQGSRATRAQRQYIHTIELGLLAKIGTEEGAQQEDLDKLAEDLLDWFFTHPLGSSRAEQLDSVSSLFIFDPEEVLDKKIFVSRMSLNFRAFRI